VRSLRVISDAHMMPPGPRCDFHVRTTHLLASALLQWHRQGDSIVCAGDMLDLTQCEATDDEIARLGCYRAVRHAVEEIMDTGGDIRYVRGNHDRTATHWFGVPARGYTTVDGIWITHGHRLDPFNHGRWRWVGEACTAVAGALEHLHRDADLWLGHVAARVLNKGRYGDAVKYRKKAVSEYEALAPACGLRGVVIGHTHKHAAWDGVYGNSGTLTGYVRGPWLPHVCIEAQA
jgi:predicted phosphodiesterase